MTAYTIPEACAAKLLAAMNSGRLVILAGAGLSMAAPSNLPSAATLGKQIADQYRLHTSLSLPTVLESDLETKC